MFFFHSVAGSRKKIESPCYRLGTNWMDLSIRNVKI